MNSCLPKRSLCFRKRVKAVGKSRKNITLKFEANINTQAYRHRVNTERECIIVLHMWVREKREEREERRGRERERQKKERDKRKKRGCPYNIVVLTEYGNSQWYCYYYCSINLCAAALYYKTNSAVAFLMAPPTTLGGAAIVRDVWTRGFPFHWRFKKCN